MIKALKLQVVQGGCASSHLSNSQIPLELNIFDVNQPATSLLCKVRSAVQLSATLTDCQATDSSGHVMVDVPMEEPSSPAPMSHTMRERCLAACGQGSMRARPERSL